MPGATKEAADGGGSAPVYPIPQKRIVSIEHPCIVKNFDNGFKSLGGEHQLKHVLEHEAEDKRQSAIPPVAVASLRPSDPFAKKLPSTAAVTQNVVMKVTLPKWTGRKRKRGSDEPYEAATAHDRQNDCTTAPELLRRLHDNSDKYKVQAIGIIENTHHFTKLPDFQVRADEIPIMREIREHAMSPSYNKLKKFNINVKPDSDEINTFPGPPNFLNITQPYQYEYKQANTGNSQAGKSQTKKKKTVKRKHGLSMLETGITLETDPAPQGPPSATPAPPGKIVSKCIEALKTVLQSRPIITLRAARSMLQDHTMKAIAQSVQHCGYYISKGPWEGSIVRYGVDPREDPKYRFYQTLKLKVKHNREINKILRRRGQRGELHMFDGKTLLDVAEYWQLCDFPEPTLLKLMNTEEIRAQCEPKQWGWYFNGTISKLRVIVVEKMREVVNLEKLVLDRDFEVLARLPNQIAAAADCRIGAAWSPYVRELAQNIAREATRERPKKQYNILQLQREELGGQTGSGAMRTAVGDGENGENEDEEGEDHDVSSGQESEGEGEDEDDDEDINEAKVND